MVSELAPKLCSGSWRTPYSSARPAARTGVGAALSSEASVTSIWFFSSESLHSRLAESRRLLWCLQLAGLLLAVRSLLPVIQ